MRHAVLRHRSLVVFNPPAGMTDAPEDISDVVTKSLQGWGVVDRGGIGGVQ